MDSINIKRSNRRLYGMPNVGSSDSIPNYEASINMTRLNTDVKQMDARSSVDFYFITKFQCAHFLMSDLRRAAAG
jgi:hypothetical protein